MLCVCFSSFFHQLQILRERRNRLLHHQHPQIVALPAAQSPASTALQSIHQIGCSLIHLRSKLESRPRTGRRCCSRSGRSPAWLRLPAGCCHRRRWSTVWCQYTTFSQHCRPAGQHRFDSNAAQTGQYGIGGNDHINCVDGNNVSIDDDHDNNSHRNSGHRCRRRQFIARSAMLTQAGQQQLTTDAHQTGEQRCDQHGNGQ